MLGMLERRTMGRPKKAPTQQIRLASDVVDMAWRVSGWKGYRAAGDFLSDMLRPQLLAMEAEIRGEKPAPEQPARKKGGAK